MADQPQEDESQDNVGTGAEISTENNAPAHFYDVPVEDESQDNAGTGAEISTDNDAPANSYGRVVDAFMPPARVSVEQRR